MAAQKTEAEVAAMDGFSNWKTSRVRLKNKESWPVLFSYFFSFMAFFSSSISMDQKIGRDMVIIKGNAIILYTSKDTSKAWLILNVMEL